jgi:hypothetical protein
MLNDNVLMQLNASIRRLGRDSIVLVNGHSTNYSVLRGQEKVQMRKRILDHLRQLPAERREDVIMQKRAAAARLAERSSEFTDKPPPAGSLLSTPEIERRRAALAKARQAEVVQSDSVKKDLAMSPVTEEADDSDQTFMQEATTQDSIVELIVEIQELRAEFAELKHLLLEQKQVAVIPSPATAPAIQPSVDIRPSPMPVELFINISVKSDGSVSQGKTKPGRKPAATVVPNGKTSETAVPPKKAVSRKVKSSVKAPLAEQEKINGAFFD